jgi:glutamyl-Q tRNA(Asp) synthetase
VADGCEVAFEDAVHGHVAQRVDRDVGDFVLLRADGLWAYQLAVVVDDAEQGITHVVRGADLLDSTPRQILLQRALGLPTPRYAHLPLLGEDGGSCRNRCRAAGRCRRSLALRLLWTPGAGAPPGARGHRHALPVHAIDRFRWSGPRRAAARIRRSAQHACNTRD